MAAEPSSKNFYRDLPVFSSFDEIAELSSFHAMPDDWVLLVADVVGSTKAIESGAYKNVNMIGAASIICVLNVSGDISLPFVFGGDGGLIAVPPELVEVACAEMSRLQATSKSMFGLSLRAAAIPVGDLKTAGAETNLKKFELSKGNNLAMFSGTGPTLADDWLKADETSRGYAVEPDTSEEPPDLEGLSCRWEPLKSHNGVMLTVILVPISDDPKDNITKTTDQFSSILGDRVAQFAPAQDRTMKFRFPPKGLGIEVASGAKQSTKFKRTVWAYFTALMQYFCEKHRIKIGDYDGATYREELKSNTDYRKYDGALRMVLDVSLEQADEIEAFLEKQYQAGHLLYGTWRSDHALMTCLLFNLAESEHIHFIDGSDGGYAMAAKGLKQRKAALSSQ